MDYLHGENIIHRDLKPSNIFLKGKDYTVQIGDFGIACNNQSGQTRVEDVGTLLYQSPEILTDNVNTKSSSGHDSRTDVWSFGCILI